MANPAASVPGPTEDQPMLSVQQNTSLPPHNPYVQKKSYKDAFLAEVESATNCLGVDTFKLIHLIHSQKQSKEGKYDTDDVSTSSAETQTQTNGKDWYTSRMRFQITIPETTQETFMYDLTQKVNQVLEVVNLNTPGVKLAPWHTTSAKKRRSM